MLYVGFPHGWAPTAPKADPLSGAPRTSVPRAGRAGSLRCARGAIKSAAPARRPCADSARSGLPEPATVPLRPAYLPTDMDAERQPRRGICPNDAPQRVGREIWTEHTMVCSVHISLPTLCGASFGQIPRRGCRSASMSVGRYAGRNGTVAGSGSPLRAESAQGRRAGAADLIAPRAHRKLPARPARGTEVRGAPERGSALGAVGAQPCGNPTYSIQSCMLGYNTAGHRWPWDISDVHLRARRVRRTRRCARAPRVSYADRAPKCGSSYCCAGL